MDSERLTEEFSRFQNSQAERELRNQAHTAPIDPDHWFPVLESRRLRPGRAAEVRLFGSSLVVYRSERGMLGALENRCAHRNIRLSGGRVEGDLLACPYHGWKYDASGTLKEIHHHHTTCPKARVRPFPIREHYDLIWVFPGRVGQADKAELPTFEPYEKNRNDWKPLPYHHEVAAHYTFVIENSSDLYHEFLHTGTAFPGLQQMRLDPFKKVKMTDCRRSGDAAFASYESDFADGFISKRFGTEAGKNFGPFEVEFRYPYHFGRIGNAYGHLLAPTPIDERTTGTFFVFFIGPAMDRVPRFLHKAVLFLMRHTYVKKVLAQDNWAMAEEQLAFEAHGASSLELNSLLPIIQQIVVERGNKALPSTLERRRGVSARRAERAEPKSV